MVEAGEIRDGMMQVVWLQFGAAAGTARDLWVSRNKRSTIMVRLVIPMKIQHSRQTARLQFLLSTIFFCNKYSKP